MKKILILTIISCLVSYSQTASKYYDGPIIAYKFGFAIEGYQHRHEEKDEKGQIMGEFGFVTADGVYHLTGYGTDENGNYKILFTKNIRIGLPGEPGSQPAPSNLSPEQTKDTPAPSTKLIPMTKPDINLQFKQLMPSDTPSCSGCIIPEIEKKIPVTKKPKPLLPASFISPDEDASTNVDPLEIKKGENVPISKSDKPAGLDVRLNGNIPSDGITGGSKKPGNQIQTLGVSKGTISPGKDSKEKTTFDTSRQISGKPTSSSAVDKEISLVGTSKSSSTSGRPVTSKLLSTSGRPDDAIKPSSISDGKVSSGVSGEGRQRITGGILYKFNYTVGYHGHHEQGDQVGAKDGGYYFVGRDGFKRTVDYNANEFGFQPHVKLVQANPQDIPQQETEKEAGLKGYEFKWFNI